MAASKAKTTMSKLNRERKIQERRLAKEARKAARAQTPADETEHVDHRDYWLNAPDQSAETEADVTTTQ